MFVFSLRHLCLQYDENGNFRHKVGESEFLAKSFKPFSR